MDILSFVEAEDDDGGRKMMVGGGDLFVVAYGDAAVNLMRLMKQKMTMGGGKMMVGGKDLFVVVRRYRESYEIEYTDSCGPKLN